MAPTADGAPRVLAVEVPAGYVAQLRAQRTPVIEATPEAPLNDAMRNSDILLYWSKDRRHAARFVAELPALRWMHVPWIGVERLMFPRIRSGEVLLTHSGGSASIPVAEYALGALLAISKGFTGHWEHQRHQRWTEAPLARELRGQHLLVVGHGGIGRQVGMLAHGLGMQVQAVAQTAREDAGIVVHAAEALDGLLPWADFVVLALPSSSATRGLFDARRLALMSAKAWLVNVGRGDLVHEAALLARIRAGGLAGAWLDVVQQEPLAAGSPLWDEPGIVLTPHASSWTRERFDRSFDLFLQNLGALTRGLPLSNVVISMKETEQ